MVLEALPALVELSIIDSDDGLSPDIEGIEFAYWSEGSEVTFEDFLEYSRLSGDERATVDRTLRDGMDPRQAGSQKIRTRTATAYRTVRRSLYSEQLGETRPCLR